MHVDPHNEEQLVKYLPQSTSIVSNFHLAPSTLWARCLSIPSSTLVDYPL